MILPTATLTRLLPQGFRHCALGEGFKMPPKYAEPQFRKARLLMSLEETITLVVGNGAKVSRFLVHKSVVCAASPFVAAACKPEWMSSEDREIKLLDDDPETIQAMVYWMYHDEICLLDSIKRRDFDCTTTSEAAMKTIWGLLAKLYVCGDKYQMPRLQNHAMDGMIDFSESCGFDCPGIIPWVYENTSSDAKIRFLLVVLVRGYLDRNDIRECQQSLCSEFLYDLTLASFVSGDGEEQEEPEVTVFTVANDYCLQFHTHVATASGKVSCEILKRLEFYDPQKE